MPSTWREYRRVNAPMIHRPTNRFAAVRWGSDPVEVPAGLRSWSDDPMRPGDLLEVDVLLPGGETASAVVRVAWSEPQPDGAPARFDVGLQLVRAVPADLRRIESVLAPA